MFTKYKQVQFYTKNISRLCLKHAIYRAQRGEYVNSRVINSSSLNCLDCFTESLNKTCSK